MNAPRDWTLLCLSCGAVVALSRLFSCSWVPGYLGTWVPGYLGTWVPGYLGTWAPGCAWDLAVLGTWVPGYLGTWVPGYLGTWVPGYLGTWVPGYLGTWVPGYLGTPGHLGVPVGPQGPAVGLRGPTVSPTVGPLSPTVGLRGSDCRTPSDSDKRVRHFQDRLHRVENMVRSLFSPPGYAFNTKNYFLFRAFVLGNPVHPVRTLRLQPKECAFVHPLWYKTDK